MFEKVRAIIAEQLGIDKEKIQPESHLINDLKADSLDVVALVMDLEQEYGIEIPDEDLAQLPNRAEHPGLHRQAGKKRLNTPVGWGAPQRERGPFAAFPCWAFFPFPICGGPDIPCGRRA